MPFDLSESQSAQQPAGPDRSGDWPETQPFDESELELAAGNEGLDPDDAYASLDEADKAIWDASARVIKT